jgi:hypothetical protein
MFFDCLKKTDIKEKFLKFDQEFNIPYMGIKDLNGVMVRDCYEDLYEKIIKIDEDGLTVMGNPGIGKTMFGYYFIYRFIQKGFSIAYEPFVDTVWIYHGDSTKQYASSQVECLTNNGLVKYAEHSRCFVHIVDGHHPYGALPFKTVLICSPRKMHYEKFEKEHSTLLYMPVWNYQEIEACRAKLFNYLTLDSVNDLFIRFDGIPRELLFNHKRYLSKYLN